MKYQEKNQFFDINKLPPNKGLLLFGLSMNKLANRQNPQNCIDDVRKLTPVKMVKPLIGLNFIYSDFLYLYSDKPAPELKDSFMNQVIQHKNATQRIIEKNPLEFQIHHGFNWTVWNQLYVGSTDFDNLLRELKRVYDKDLKFQELVKKDCETFDREMEENQINFFLEEWLMFYLLTKNKVQISNDFIENKQEWILMCYPGNPLRGHVYLYQLNPFNFEWNENPYQNAFYNLDTQQLIDFDNVDLNTYVP